jgi:hypothetical protein
MSTHCNNKFWDFILKNLERYWGRGPVGRQRQRLRGLATRQPTGWKHVRRGGAGNFLTFSTSSHRVPTQLLDHRMLRIKCELCNKQQSVQCWPSHTSIMSGTTELWFMQHHTLFLIITLQLSWRTFTITAVKSSSLRKVSLCWTFKFMSNAVWTVRLTSHYNVKKLLLTAQDFKLHQATYWDTKQTCYRHELINHCVHTIHK